MKPYKANLVNAIILIILGLWGYFLSDTPSLTSFIPVATGVILLLFTPGLKKESKSISHFAVIVTFVILIGLIKPLTGAIHRQDTWAIIRVLIMMISSVCAMSFFIKSFLDARRVKNNL